MQDRIDALIQKYPKLYAESYDVYVGPGWLVILESLSAQIQHHIDHTNSYIERFGHTLKYPLEPVEQAVVLQVKEKFGGLRFYYDGGDSAIAGMVTMAEEWASHTCEECGKPGKSRDLSWVKTLCDEHYEQRKNK